MTSGAEPPPFPARVLPATPALHHQIRSAIVSRSKSPYTLTRRIIRGVKETLYFPDATASWMAPAIRAGLSSLSTESYDAVLSTALPPSAHVIGWILAKKSGLPWIADYRDPWQQNNPYLQRGPLRAWLEALLERGMLRRASAITTISEAIAVKLATFHKRRDVHVIPNAYDPADWEQIPDLAPQRFDLCYTGTMYSGKRTPDLLFAALTELRNAGEAPGAAARVHFYGPNSDNVTERATAYGLNLIVRQHGVVPRAAAMRAQRSSAAVLIFLNMDESTGEEMGSKYLEYIGAHRPVIAFGPRNSMMRDFLARSHMGWFASNVDEAKHALREAFARFSSGQFDVRVESASVPTAYELARSFADVLDGVTARASVRSIA